VVRLWGWSVIDTRALDRAGFNVGHSFEIHGQRAQRLDFYQMGGSRLDGGCRVGTWFSAACPPKTGAADAYHDLRLNARSAGGSRPRSRVDWQSSDVGSGRRGGSGSSVLEHPYAARPRKRLKPAVHAAHPDCSTTKPNYPPGGSAFFAAGRRRGFFGGRRRGTGPRHCRPFRKAARLTLISPRYRFVAELDGLEVCKQIRKSSDLPILFLSARDEEIDRVLGLEIGGDDYVTKPFSSA
jgi:hypothetical protein